eukprot:GHVN01058734.1.p1 GENE.GHVN01058734.1~~GHVN01058734.1.p1  ORF type:complete len:458 (-),score=114.02 GHVN01058734.1:1889-3262(-)
MGIVDLYDRNQGSSCWSVPTGRAVTSIALSSDGTYIAAGIEDGLLLVYDIRNANTKRRSTPLHVLASHSKQQKAPIHDIRFASAKGPTGNSRRPVSASHKAVSVERSQDAPKSSRPSSGSSNYRSSSSGIQPQPPLSGKNITKSPSTTPQTKFDNEGETTNKKESRSKQGIPVPHTGVPVAEMSATRSSRSEERSRYLTFDSASVDGEDSRDDTTSATPSPTSPSPGVISDRHRQQSRPHTVHGTGTGTGASGSRSERERASRSSNRPQTASRVEESAPHNHIARSSSNRTKSDSEGVRQASDLHDHFSSRRGEDRDVHGSRERVSEVKGSESRVTTTASGGDEAPSADNNPSPCPELKALDEILTRQLQPLKDSLTSLHGRVDRLEGMVRERNLNLTGEVIRQCHSVQVSLDESLNQWGTLHEESLREEMESMRNEMVKVMNALYIPELVPSQLRM